MGNAAQGWVTVSGAEFRTDLLNRSGPDAVRIDRLTIDQSLQAGLNASQLRVPGVGSGPTVHCRGGGPPVNSAERAVTASQC